MKNALFIPLTAAFALTASVTTAAAGDSTTCIPVRAIDQISASSESKTIIVKMNGNKSYKSKYKGSCDRANRANNYLQYNSSETKLCKGQVIKVIDGSTNMMVGSCSVGKFKAVE